MQERQKQKRQAFFCTKRRGHRQAYRGVLPSFASAASLFYGPAEIYSPLLLFSPSLFFTRMNGCTYTFTVELWPAKNPQQTQDASHESSLSGFSFPAPPPQTKKTTRASEGSKGLDKALRWRWGWWRFIISMMERERKQQLRDERSDTWTRESLLGKEVPRDVNYGDGWFWVRATTEFCAQQQTNVYMDEIFNFKDIMEVLNTEWSLFSFFFSFHAVHSEIARNVHLTCDAAFNFSQKRHF